jgi:hypothetical protein
VKLGKVNPKQQLELFLDPTATVPKTDRPTISQYYYDTFSGVDRFNQLLGYIPYDHKCQKPNLVWLLGVLRMCSVNAFALQQEHKQVKDEEEDVGSVPQFIVNVIEGLKSRNK